MFTSCVTASRITEVLVGANSFTLMHRELFCSTINLRRHCDLIFFFFYSCSLFILPTLRLKSILMLLYKELENRSARGEINTGFLTVATGEGDKFIHFKMNIWAFFLFDSERTESPYACFFFLPQLKSTFISSHLCPPVWIFPSPLLCFLLPLGLYQLMHWKAGVLPSNNSSRQRWSWLYSRCDIFSSHRTPSETSKCQADTMGYN